MSMERLNAQTEKRPTKPGQEGASVSPAVAAACAALRSSAAVEGSVLDNEMAWLGHAPGWRRR